MSSTSTPQARQVPAPTDTAKAGQDRLGARQIARALGLPRPTEQQQEIIEHPPSPLLVVAGAGSGKTETMAARVVWLVANGHAEPDQVLGLTFTRKAAGELAGRVGSRLRALTEAGLWRPTQDGSLVTAPPLVATYHAYAAQLVREHALRVGREPDARLLSEAASWQLASDVVAAFDGPLEELGRADSTITNAVVDLAGELAEHLVSPERLEGWLRQLMARIDELGQGSAASPAAVRTLRATLAAKAAMVPLLESYARAKIERGSMDFADQMALAATLAVRRPEVGSIERERFRAVLLDEFQDTSHAQLQLLTALFGSGSQPHCLTAVGDPHQSIYAWRGASAATLAHFPQAFAADGSPVPVRPLAITWRNDVSVLEAANTIAAPLQARSAVAVQPLAPAPGAAGGRIEVQRHPDTRTEAEAVADWIAARRDAGADSCAVLARKRSQFPEIVAALEAVGLPVEVVGLGGLLLTPEVSDIVALLSVAHDAGRGDRLMRLLTGPVARLGAADLTRLHDFARARQRRGSEHRNSDLSAAANDRISLVEAVTDLPGLSRAAREDTGLSRPALDRLDALAGALQHLRAATGSGLVDVVAEAERALGLDIEVCSRPNYSPAVARAHLDAFADVAAEFALSGDRPTLGGFLAWLDAAVAQERGLDRGVLDIAPGAVHVLTVHAAKGLEWDAVAIPGLVEGGFPAHGAGSSRHDPDSGMWRIKEPNESAWTVGLDGLPYDLRGDASALPGFDWRSAGDSAQLARRLSDFKAAAGSAGIAEERRLAYVALTRARHQLLLSCSVWGSQTTPRVPSRFLTELRTARPDLLTTTIWHEDPESGAQNPALASPVTAQWPAPLEPADGVVVAAAHVLDALDTGPMPGELLDPALPVLLAERAERHAGSAGFAARRANGAWRPLEALGGHLTTSQLVDLAGDPEGFAARVRRPMPTRPSASTRRGTAFHAWVERHFRAAALIEPDELPGSADDDQGQDLRLERLIERFLASHWAGRDPLEVEVMVETVIGGAAIRGRIDAVFAEPDGQVTIVDWKSGHPPSGAAAHAAAVQLAAYRIAYARLRGLDADQVRAAFYYAASGETRYPPMRSAADLGSLVAILGAPPRRSAVNEAETA